MDFLPDIDTFQPPSDKNEKQGARAALVSVMPRLPCRRLGRRLVACIVVSLSLAALVLWTRTPSEETRGALDGWINVKLSAGQRQYMDRNSGMRVIVGHYMGAEGAAASLDASNATPNLTREILDSNLFSPNPEDGKDGQPVVVRSHDLMRMRQLYRINRFNLMASDRVPLNRSLPDVRKKRCETRYSFRAGLPSVSVVIVFHNEAWSTLLRTVHSVINRSPRAMLKEILLVDDYSDRAFLRSPLEDHVAALPVPTRVLRQTRRGGLVSARLRGARQAEGDVLVFLDAHCEVTKGWLESLVIPIAEDRKNVVCPIIDIISDDTFAYIRSFELHWGAFNWQLHFRWYTLGNSETPAMAGGLFAIDKEYFFEIGSYDEQMDIWGGENLELSFRRRCYRGCKVARSAGDTLEAQLEEQTQVPQFCLIIHQKSERCLQRPLGQGSISSPIGTAQILNCLSLKPPLLVQMFVMSRDGFVMTDESVCLDARLATATESASEVRISACSQLDRQRWTFHETNSSLVHKVTGLCLTGPDREEGTELTIEECAELPSQKWKLEAHPWK
ncbi:hypothetical protein B566_EDAN007805 [Ephemera danica]|nr:hypothetical protein B566_EDAN007805 [Ephemera danica]